MTPTPAPLTRPGTAASVSFPSYVEAFSPIAVDGTVAAVVPVSTLTEAVPEAAADTVPEAAADAVCAAGDAAAGIAASSRAAGTASAAAPARRSDSRTGTGAG